MHRSKFVVAALAIAHFLFFTISAFGEITKNGRAVPISDSSTIPLRTECTDCPNYPPAFDPPTQESFYICEGSTIFDTIVVTDVDTWQTLSLALYSGPGIFDYTPSVSPAKGYYEYMPTEEGTYEVVYEATDGESEPIYFTKTYVIYFDHYPIITNGGVVEQAAVIGEEISYDVDATDAEDDPITFSLVSGDGTIDSHTGMLTFTPLDYGIYEFEVEVSDSCGSDISLITFDIFLGFILDCPPESATEFICQPDTLCYPIGGIPEAARVTVEPSLAWFDWNKNSVCFYTNCSVIKDIKVIVSTENLRCEGDDCPPVDLDSCMFTVDVTLNSDPIVMLPEDQSFWLCEPTEICVPAGIDDLDNNIDNIMVEILPGGQIGNYSEISGNACFTPTASGIYEMIVTAWDECEAQDVDTINLDVTINSAPTATCSPTQELLVCDLSPVTLSGFICDDIDGNLVSCEVDNGTLVDDNVTFTPVEGDNIITLTAADECGAVTTCQTVVTVTLNSPPSATCSPIQELLVCDLSPITLSGFICDDIDGNLASCVVDNGVLNAEEVTFTPVEGENVITLTATDECGMVTTCQTTIMITLNSAPSVICPADQELFVCDLSPITIPGFICDDINGNLISCETDKGTLSGNDLTFTPIEGENVITLTATDECGEETVCQTIIMVTVNGAPVATCPFDQELFVCDLSEITISGFSCDDIDGNLISCEVDNGILVDGEVTFIPVEGENIIEITATDECGEVSICQTTVTITLNSPPTATCPHVKVRALCDLSPITLSGFVCDDIDGNLVSCEVDNGILNGNDVTFTPVEGENVITLIATDACGEVTTCQTIVTLILNSGPTASVPVDQELFVCDLSPITLSGFVCDDVDGNLISCEVDNGMIDGSDVTFTPVVGTNTITLTATDKCGLSASNQVIIKVSLNSPPTVTCSGDQELFVCDLSQITLPGFVCDDIDGNLVSCETDNGTINGTDLTFTPVAGENLITLTATDECGEVTACQTIITVILNSPPTATCPGDIELFVCDLSEICIEGFICDDIDGNLLTCEVTGGYFIDDPDRSPVSKSGSAVIIENLFNYNETDLNSAMAVSGRAVCFNPVEGTNVITLTVTDECGEEVICQTTITVTLNSSPTASVPEPAELFVCDLSDITIPGFICDDIDGNLISCEVDNGVLLNGEVTFTPTAGLNTITLTATDECGEVAINQTTVMVNLNSAPTVTCPEDLQLLVCDLSPITVAGFFFDDSDGNLISAEVDNGNLVDGEVTFTPVEGENIITLTATDECGAVTTCQTTVTVILNSPPAVTCPPAQDLLVCDLSSITLPGLFYDDVDGNLMSVEVDNGSLVGNDVIFSPVEGENIIILTAIDECGVIAVCQTTINVILNNPPTATTPENQQLYLCDLSPITLDGFICGDIDGNLISCEVNNGTITGEEVTFVPTAGINTIILTATDECGLTATSEFTVEVEVAPAFELVCPEDVSEFICGPGTLSYQIDGIPLGAAVTVAPSSAWFNVETSEVCFYTNCSVEKEIVVTVETDCFTEVCQFTSSVTMNSNPLVVLPPDESHWLCDPAEICFVAGINDIDYNLAEITIDVQPFDPNAPAAFYNEISGKVCFTPMTSGQYEIYVTARDTCDSTDTDTIIVDVVINSAPTATCALDQQFLVCDLSPLTISGFICGDVDGNLVSCEVDNGTLSGTDVIFTPVEGENIINFTVIDECGKVSSCQAIITVTLNSAPSATCPDEQNLFVCDLSPITISGFVCDDFDGNLVSCEVDNGTLTGSDVTFMPVVGENIITLTVTDECGAVTTCQTIVNVSLNSVPTATCPGTQELFVCDLSPIIVTGFGYDDPDGNLISAEVDNGTLIEGDVTLTPIEGENIITLTVTDECGETATCQTTVLVTLNSPPTATCPNEQELFVCDLSPVTIGGFLYDDADANLLNAGVDNGTLSGTDVTFTPVDGENIITLTVTDECGEVTTCQTVVTVSLNSSPTATCPAEQNLFVCDLSPITISGFICDDIDGNLANCEIDNGTLTGSDVTFMPVVGENIITLTVTDECGAVTTCQTIVNVSLNSVPTATCPGTLELFVCDLSPIIVTGFGYDDPDGNLISAEVDNGTLIEGDVTLTPIEGENIITLTVTDECGETATCQTTVLVTLNSPPTVTCAADQQMLVLDLSPITLSGFYCDDIDGNLMYCEVDNGTLSGTDVTFTPVEGENIITLTVTDECGEVTTCQTVVTVSLNSPPTATCPAEQNLFVCELSEITISGFICDDIDGNLANCEVDNGILTGNDVTFMPVEGANIITLTATDECGATATCQTIINVSMNNTPTATSPIEQNLFVCDLSPITISGFNCDDIDGNLLSCEVDNGTLIDDEVTFTPVEGVNAITLTAIDECGETAASQTTVTISLNSPPTATCVPDQLMYVLDLSPITISGFYCEDFDGNLMYCEVDNGTLIEGEVTFTPIEGDNVITLTATDECGEVATCQTTITVAFDNPPIATCSGDQILIVYDLGEICIPGFICDDIDDNLISCEISDGSLIDGSCPPMPSTKTGTAVSLGSINDNNSANLFDASSTNNGKSVIFTPVEGVNILTLTATDECGVVSICQTVITVVLNSAPTATCPGNQELFVCNLSPITIPGFICDDIDGNLVSCEIDNGILNGSEVTFTPIVGANTITLIATDEFGEVATCQTVVTVNLNSAPTVICPGDQELFVCDLSPITIPGFVCDDIDENLVSCEVNNGTLNGYDLTFTPVEGENIITLTAIDECGEEAGCQVTITVTLNSQPTATCPGNQELFVCDYSPITVSGFICDDIDGNLATCEVDNGIISGDAVTFTPVFGENIITLTATDECGLVATCQTIITVSVNNSPTAATPEDQQKTVCDLSELTIPGFVCDDIDENLVSCEVSNGTLNGYDLIFTPVEGLNTIILTATDDCGETATSEFNITIDVTPGFELTCPQSSTIFLCEPIALRYPIYGIPEGATVTVVPSSAWYDAETGEVGFFTNCSVVRDIEVYVETECQTEVCRFTVTAIMNSAPLVMAVPDTTLAVCENEPACIPAGVTDIDGNIASITVRDKITGFPMGSYDPVAGGICFMPEVSGEYELILEAIDECGAKDADTSRVNVTINTPPTVTCPGDMELFVCDLSEICLDGFICDDIDGNLVSCEVDNGTLIDNSVCFTPVEGVNTITLMAIDGCDDTVICVSNITVTLNTPPTATTPDDTEMFVCDLSDICLEGFICDDVDGNIVSCEVNNGILDGNTVCFTPVEGVNTITLTATDECGETSASETNITITLNTPPTVTCAESFELFVCDLSDITLTGFDCDDIDKNLVSCEVDNGIMNGSEVTFTPVDGINEITLTATDECGATTSCVTTVTVTLNSPPTITAPENQDIIVCDLSEICLDGFSCDDDDGNIVSFEITGATLEGTTACFTPILGENIISMTTIDECGESASRDIIFNVIMSEPPEIIDPGNQVELLCEAGPVCTDIVITPPEAVVTVSALFSDQTITGTYEENQVCFRADAEGTYTVTVHAETPCGTASVTYTVDVEFNVAPVINAGADFEIFQCDFIEYSFLPDLLEDANNNIASVVVSHGGYYNETTGEICFLPTGVGEYCLEITVTDDCQLTASDIICINVTSGEAAAIDCPVGDIDTLVCDPGEMCIPLLITPSSAQVTVSQGTYDIEKGELCFDANYAGTYVIDVDAEDACGSDYCQVTVNVVFGDSAKITCPDLPVSASLCEAGTVPVFLPIKPDTAHVTVSPFGSYNPDTDELTFHADTSGLYEFTVVAEAPCLTAECLVQVNVSIEEAPQIDCPDEIIRTVCLPVTDSICFPLEITGSTAEVTISPNGRYEDGVVCIPISGAGTYPIEITAINYCGTSTCSDIDVIVYEDLPPTLTVPENRIISSCTDVMEEICIDGIYGSDPDSDEFTIQKISGPGTYIPAGADSGTVCFTPESNDITYTFEIEISDGCHTIVKSFNVTIYPSNVCETCIELAIETDTCYIVGSTVPVHITVNTYEEIGGFDLLLYYDASVMAFLSIEQGDVISEWEYLTYSHEDVNCGGACPTGMIRIIGIADRTIPVTHPPEEQLTPSGTMVTLNMRISRDQNIGGLFLPMGFYWYDCGDNTFSDPTGNVLYMDGIILDAFGGVIWDEANEDLFPEENRIQSIGAPDTCLTGDKITPIRCVEFKNGGICVIHPDDIDDRGDLNLNGVAYEIADAVVYTNYFIYGFSAFLVNVDGQTAASDINRDGIPLTVADLVYLIRILTGDVPPSPKVAPPGSSVKLMTQIDNNRLSIKGDINYPTGAGLFVFEYNDAVPQVPHLGGIASDMDVVYNITDSEIRILIYSFEVNRKIDVGQGDILNLGFSGNGSIRLTEAYFAGYYGERLKTEVVNNLLPGDFVLSQNYPNPFNPSTTINLTVPVACEWEIEIINTSGQVVRKFDGTTEPGTISVVWDGSNHNGQIVATGIYFYRVKAADFTETRKMILLK